MSDTPDFRELVGDDLPKEERARLERVHELLVAAGPPPELPPALAEPRLRRAEATVSFLPRRRIGVALGLAAAIALIAFFGGFLAGRTKGPHFATTFTVEMHGTSAAPDASAMVNIGKLDRSGNWPLEVVVRGLSRAPGGGYYQMYLTHHHRPAASCGTFEVSSGTTKIRLNAPYDLREYDGWVVTREQPKTHARVTVLTQSNPV